MTRLSSRTTTPKSVRAPAGFSLTEPFSATAIIDPGAADMDPPASLVRRDGPTGADRAPEMRLVLRRSHDWIAVLEGSWLRSRPQAAKGFVQARWRKPQENQRGGICHAPRLPHLSRWL